MQQVMLNQQSSDQGVLVDYVDHQQNRTSDSTNPIGAKKSTPVIFK